MAPEDSRSHDHEAERKARLILYGLAAAGFVGMAVAIALMLFG